MEAGEARWIVKRGINNRTGNPYIDFDDGSYEYLNDFDPNNPGTWKAVNPCPRYNGWTERGFDWFEENEDDDGVVPFIEFAGGEIFFLRDFENCRNWISNVQIEGCWIDDLSDWLRAVADDDEDPNR